ncbi:DUF357 domain-containing protein [Candidatus Bathyarchaeota archaeon]|nr:DUF357 domain-containing protein [Candidatus Bathyarchaeota archaeon]
MSLEELVSKYIASTERVLNELSFVDGDTRITADSARRVVESAKAYLQDAKYYRDRKRFEVSLASVAYCEGLLDALKMLGVVKFEWPKRRQNVK